MVRWLTGGSSYLSSHDKRLLFGMGKAADGLKVDIEVRWPGGTTQTVHGLAPNRYHEVKEGADSLKPIPG